MAIKYLKKSPKTPSTDDSKTNEIVKGLLKEIEISKSFCKSTNKNFKFESIKVSCLNKIGKKISKILNCVRPFHVSS